MAGGHQPPRKTRIITDIAGDSSDAGATLSDRLEPADYVSLFDKAPDAILVTNSNGHYIAANMQACRLTGYSHGELMTMKVGDLVIPTERDMSGNHFDILRECGSARHDRMLSRKDGRHVPIEAHAVALPDGRFQTILRDISARLATQSELEQSLGAYGTLVELCHAAVISANASGRITFWNHGAAVLLGYSAKEAVGMVITRLMPRRLWNLHGAGFRRHVLETTQDSRGRTIHTEALRKDGSTVQIELSVAVGMREGEQVFTAVIRDVTEQRETLERLNDALQRLQFHVERTPLGYVVFDVAFRVQEWNHAAERMFGYSRSEAVGQSGIDLIIPPDTRPTVDVVWQKLLLGDRSSHSINANVRKDGSRLTCEWFNTPLHNSAGRVHAVASMVMDVSEREVLEREIRHKQKLESLGVLAGGVAHDFNSALMVILGNTSLLRSVKRLPKKAAEHIELIDEAGSRAHELTKHLLTYARTGRHDPQPTRLNAVVEDTLALVRSTLGHKHAVQTKLEADLPTIEADHNQIGQVVLNLCLNAAQSMPGGGTIQLLTRRARLSRLQAAQAVPPDAEPGAFVELCVSDTGSGMSDATRLRIFDPFFTTKKEGHGLGLAAVLGILRQHSAMALVESKAGKGTTMRVFIPIPAGTPPP